MALKLRDMLTGGNGRADSGIPAVEQITALTRRNRQKRDAKRESKLVHLRHRAFGELDRRPPEGTPPERLTEVEGTPGLEVIDGLPTIEAKRLDPHTVRAAFLSHGSLLVRGLIDPKRTAELAAGIDRAFDGRDAFLDGVPVRKTAPWFEPFTPSEQYATSGKEWNRHVKGGGSVWAVDSPRMMFDLLEAFEEVGIPELAQAYLGERPVFSMKKAVLRRVSADSGAAWHQDGAFLGEGIRTINVWVALTRCGDEAPGLDIVSRRLEEIVPTGTEGALFDWAVSDTLVAELPGAEVVRPIFEAGDALLFDHLCLHRTAAEPGMPNQRYATETWCFAPSSFPEKQIPIVI